METDGPARFEVQAFAGANELAHAAARRLVERLNQRQDVATPFCLAISGGRISGDFFRAVAAIAGSRPRVFNNVHFFWADERCVPADNSDSNYRLASESMLEPLGIPPARVHRIRGEIDPVIAAAEAEGRVRQVCTNSMSGIPVLDLVLLGMGEDGHVASLFPPAPLVDESNEPIFRAVVAPKPPPRRITMTYRALTNATDVWVLVAGSGKETAYQNSIMPDGRTPLARVIHARRATVILRNFDL